MSSVLSRNNLVLLPAGVFLFSLPFTHTIALRLICLFAAACIVFYQWWRRPPPAPPCRWPLAFWFVVCFLASVWSIEPDYSWGEFRNEVLYTLLAFGVFYYLTKADEAWHRWRAILLAACCILSVYAIANYIRIGKWVATGLVGDQNAFSTYVVVIAPFLFLAIAQTNLKTTVGKLAWLAGLLALVSGYCSLNRTMWVTLMIEATVFVFLYLRKTAKSGRNANTWSWVIAGAVCSLFLALFLIVSHVKGRTEGVSVAQIEQSFSYDLRPKIWSYALQRIRERPLKGYGYGRGILRADFRSHLNNRGAWHAHNVILNYMLEAGPLGVLALLGLFVALLREFWKLYRSEHRSAWQCGACALALLLGVASKAMTDDILVRDNALLFWSQIGMILGLARHMAEDSTRGRKLDLPGT